MLQAPTRGFSEFLLHRASFSATSEVIFLKDYSIEDLMELTLRWTPLQREHMAVKMANTYEFAYPEGLMEWIHTIGAPRLAAQQAVDKLYTFRLLHCTMPECSVSIPEYQDHPFDPRAIDFGEMNLAKARQIDVFDPLVLRNRRTPRF